MAPGEDVPALLSRVEAIEVPFYPRAKVVVNERTGTVVIGGSVVLQPVSILHGGLAVNIVSEFQVSQPGRYVLRHDRRPCSRRRWRRRISP